MPLPPQIERVFDLSTDAGGVALFDPEMLAHRVEAAPDWWEEDEVLLSEANHGRLAAWRTSEPGIYRVAIRPSAGETEPELTLWLEVRGQLCLTGLEWLPADGDEGPGSKAPESFSVPAGKYRVELSRPPSEDEEAPDYVLALLPLEGEPPALPAELAQLDPAEHPFPADDPEKTTKAEELLAQAVEGETEERRAALDQALELDPRHFQLLNVRSNLRAQNDDVEGGLADATRASQVSPMDPTGWLLRALLLIRMGRPLEGLGAAQRACELAMGSPQVWDVLGDAQAALEDPEAARSAWQEAVERGHPEKRAIKLKIAQGG